MVAKRKKKVARKKVPMDDVQQRNSDIFRLRGFYANARTLPFSGNEISAILNIVDDALLRLDAEIHSDYLKRKAKLRRHIMSD